MGKVITSDTLDVFVCHLPSRYGGEKESEADRFDAARTLRHLCDSLLQIRKTPQLLIMGDFNAHRKTPVSHKYCLPEKPPEIRYPASSTTFCRSPCPEQPGTHKYQGEWNQLDHIIVSGNLIDKNSPMHVVPGSNRIFMPPSCSLMIRPGTANDLSAPIMVLNMRVVTAIIYLSLPTFYYLCLTKIELKQTCRYIIYWQGFSSLPELQTTQPKPSNFANRWIFRSC